MTFLMLGQMSLGLVRLRTVDADERPFCGVSLAMLVQALLAGKGTCATFAFVRPLLGVSRADVVLQAPLFNITFTTELALFPPTSCTEGNIELFKTENFTGIVLYLSDCIPERNCAKNPSNENLLPSYKYYICYLWRDIPN
jgi:hypothetical protein